MSGPIVEHEPVERRLSAAPRASEERRRRPASQDAVAMGQRAPAARALRARAAAEFSSEIGDQRARPRCRRVTRSAAEVRNRGRSGWSDAHASAVLHSHKPERKPSFSSNRVHSSSSTVTSRARSAPLRRSPVESCSITATPTVGAAAARDGVDALDREEAPVLRKPTELFLAATGLGRTHRRNRESRHNQFHGDRVGFSGSSSALTIKRSPTRCSTAAELARARGLEVLARPDESEHELQCGC